MVLSISNVHTTNNVILYNREKIRMKYSLFKYLENSDRGSKNNVNSNLSRKIHNTVHSSLWPRFYMVPDTFLPQTRDNHFFYLHILGLWKMEKLRYLIILMITIKSFIYWHIPNFFYVIDSVQKVTTTMNLS